MLAELFSFIIGIAIISQDSDYGGYQLKKIAYLVMSSVKPFHRTLFYYARLATLICFIHLGLHLLSPISAIVAPYELSFLGSCVMIYFICGIYSTHCLYSWQVSYWLVMSCNRKFFNL